MATLTIKNIPEQVVRRLKSRAASHRRSLNLEVIACLEAVTHATAVDPETLLARARSLRARARPGFRLDDRMLRAWKAAARP